MGKLLAWEQVQTLWTKIKNTFVAKDADASVKKLTLKSANGSNQVQIYSDDESAESAIIDGHLTLKNALYVKDGSTFEGSVDIKYGESLTFWNDGNSKNVSMFANSDCSKLRVGNETLATETYVTNAVANAGHLKREKVATIPGVATAFENVIYMVPATDGSGDDVFDEYMKIDGKLEKIGSNRVNLSGYSTTEQMNTAISTAVSNSYTLITDAEINALS